VTTDNNDLTQYVIPLKQLYLKDGLTCEPVSKFGLLRSRKPWVRELWVSNRTKHFELKKREDTIILKLSLKIPPYSSSKADSLTYRNFTENWTGHQTLDYRCEDQKRKKIGGLGYDRGDVRLVLAQSNRISREIAFTASNLSQDMHLHLWRFSRDFEVKRSGPAYIFILK
jgi:hypothetical protein